MSQRSSSPSESSGLVPDAAASSRIDDLTRMLSVSGNSEGEMLRNLRNMNLGDDFWIYGFKVTPCTKSYSHKWSFCPCGHVGETGRRRDPRIVPYKPDLCPIAKAKRTCPLGDNCLWAHNVFEHWLHPAKYKTRLCTFGPKCNRSICFFAHNSNELRVASGGMAGNDDDLDALPVNLGRPPRKSMPHINFSPHPPDNKAVARSSGGHMNNQAAAAAAISQGFPPQGGLLTAPQLSLTGSCDLEAETSAMLLGLPLLGLAPATSGGRRATDPYGDMSFYDSLAPHGGYGMDFFTGAHASALANGGMGNNLSHNMNGNVPNSSAMANTGGMAESTWNPMAAINSQLPPMSQPPQHPRISDPGTMVLPMLGGSLNNNPLPPVQLLDRISEGGKGASSASQVDFDHDMESVLASIVSNHQSPSGSGPSGNDASTSIPHTPAFTSPNNKSEPGSRWSTPGGLGLNSSAMPKHDIEQSRQQQSHQQQPHQQAQDLLPDLMFLMQQQQQLQQQQQVGLSQPGGRRSLNRSISSPNYRTEVDDLVARLQDQGLGNTKEELVASLSNLLSQLLSVE